MTPLFPQEGEQERFLAKSRPIPMLALCIETWWGTFPDSAIITRRKHPKHPRAKKCRSRDGQKVREKEKRIGKKQTCGLYHWNRAECPLQITDYIGSGFTQVCRSFPHTGCAQNSELENCSTSEAKLKLVACQLYFQLVELPFHKTLKSVTCLHKLSDLVHLNSLTFHFACDAEWSLGCGIVDGFSVKKEIKIFWRESKASYFLQI